MQNSRREARVEKFVFALSRFGRREGVHLINSNGVSRYPLDQAEIAFGCPSRDTRSQDQTNLSKSTVAFDDRAAYRINSVFSI
jgi:hypothetical protein